MANQRKYLYSSLSLIVAIAVFGPLCSAHAQPGSRPSLIITSDPVPTELKRQIYSKPNRVREISPAEVSGRSYYQPMQTTVSGKIGDLQNELGALQNEVASYSSNLNSIQRENERMAADYYAMIATVSTQLQSGTTPGNPRLTQRMGQAESSLESLSASVSHLNGIASGLADAGSKAAFLLEATRAAYGISGAVEEDHVRLSELEDEIHNTTVLIERVLNNVNDDLTRTSTYLSSERNNLRALNLAVANGDLYGKSLGNRPFSSAGQFTAETVSMTPASTGGEAFSDAELSASSSTMPAAVTGLAGPRPLVKIRFDRPDVNYEQPVYLAVNEALQRYPDARFDLVAVHPSRGNAAEVAIESTRARRNAERVLRTLTQMGLPLDRIDLSYNQSASAATNEVHLFIR